MKQFGIGAVVFVISCVTIVMAMRRTSGAPPPAIAGVPAADAARLSVSDLLPLVAKAGALVVDVRVERTYAAGHIAGAVNVPVDEIEARSADLIRLAAGRPIVTYCSCVHEHTSAVAALELTAAGARNVSALLGGYPAWTSQGGPVERR